ncbi:MAG: hypothetical protein WCI78_02325 [Mycobacterium sp.]
MDTPQIEMHVKRATSSVRRAAGGNSVVLRAIRGREPAMLREHFEVLASR